MRTVRFLGCICLYNLSRFGGADSLFQWNRNAYPAPINVSKGIHILEAFFLEKRGWEGEGDPYFDWHLKSFLLF